MWDEITYPFPNFINPTVEVWEWISIFLPHLMIGVITYPWWKLRSMFYLHHCRFVCNIRLYKPLWRTVHGQTRDNAHVNTLRPKQNGRHFSEDIFKCIFLNGNVQITIKISLKFVPKGPINNVPALIQKMAWRPGDKPLSEPMTVRLLIYASLGLNELTHWGRDEMVEILQTTFSEPPLSFN